MSRVNTCTTSLSVSREKVARLLERYQQNQGVAIWTNPTEERIYTRVIKDLKSLLEGDLHDKS